MINTNQKIGIIGAMEIEVKEIISKMNILATEKIGFSNFFIGTLFGCDCIVAISGVGKVCSASCAQTMILKYAPKSIINIGLAGSLKENIKINDVVIATSVVQYDVDVTAIKYSIGMVPGLGIVEIPCCQELNREIIKSLKSIDETEVFEGLIATGDQFLISQTTKDMIKRNFNAIACEMEGGSIGQVCYMNNVKFAVVRKISDNADQNSSLTYNDFELTASKKIAHIIFNFINLKVNI